MYVIILQKNDIVHSFKGTTWKDHKYIKKEHGRYIYDSKTNSERSDAQREAEREANRLSTYGQSNLDRADEVSELADKYENIARDSSAMVKRLETTQYAPGRINGRQMSKQNKLMADQLRPVAEEDRKNATNTRAVANYYRSRADEVESKRSSAASKAKAYKSAQSKRVNAMKKSTEDQGKTIINKLIEEIGDLAVQNRIKNQTKKR